MITLFSIPKRFDGHVGKIQRNAIGSWARLHGVDVLLVGNDPGVGEIAREFGLRHEPEVERTEYGTPLLSSAFAIAQATSSHSLLAYVNADIILLSDFGPAIRRVRMRRFLLAGRRWNTGIGDSIDFDDPDWESRMREVISNTGELDPPDAIDYFVMPRDSSLLDLPAFAVGRPGWDNWLITRARKTRTPVIDATDMITAVHQRHDYAHIPHGTGHGSVWAGPEEVVNRELSEGAYYGMWHATHVLKSFGPMPALGKEYVRRRWAIRHEVNRAAERLIRLLDPLLWPVRRFRRRARSAGRR